MTWKQRVPACGVDPAFMVEDALGQHAAFFAEAFCYTGGVARLESFYNHEEHGRDYILV